MAQTQILMMLSETEFISRTRNAATRCVLWAYNEAKCNCGQGSVPDPAGGAYSVSPDFLAGFKGEGEGEGKEEAGREGKRGRGEVDSDAQLEQGRQLAKAGPDLP